MLVLIGGKKDDIVLKPNKNTFQTIMTITTNVQVDFSIPNSIRTVLGFNAQINLYATGNFTWPRVPEKYPVILHKIEKHF